MAKKSDSVCKLCRRENMKLFLKAERCFTDKCAFERRPYPPGQHGQSRLKFSEYALQLREKQKLRRYYHLEENTFRHIFEIASKSTGNTGEVLLRLLETRLDNVVYLMGGACSRKNSRQMISHGHVLVNGKRITLPGYFVKPGDVVSVTESAKQLVPVQMGINSAKRRELPGWLEVNFDKVEAVIKELPSRANINTPVEERLVVEFYSR
ncbi:MAG: 30S ribosomal protein S4 [Bdellovibrionaceae bacterium]|nr:30S ribosomal protein S4 [Pseudobdellovibrionaceae bacterium]MDW8190879.1 30S ribosomal protein S4 [Pseudobdellovibrionaceae bacterium]